MAAFDAAIKEMFGLAEMKITFTKDQVTIPKEAGK